MAKRKRPSYLIMVSGLKGLEIFSAHHTEADAVAMHDRLGSMLAKAAGSVVHLVRVPDAAGLVAADKAACRRIEPKDRPTVVPMATKPQSASAPSIPQTQEEYEEETRRLVKGDGPRDGYRDDKYVGASS
jgi:hypothetical protein